MFVLFAAPPEKEVDWRTEALRASTGFLGRVYRFATATPSGAGHGLRAADADRQVLRKLTRP